MYNFNMFLIYTLNIYMIFVHNICTLYDILRMYIYIYICMAQCLLAPTPPEIGMAPFRYMDIYKVIQVCVYLYVYIIYIYIYVYAYGR
jgi:hypothetical protein